MSITVTLDSSTENLDRVSALIDRSIDVVNETLEPRLAPRLTRVAQETIGRDPGPVKYPIQWTSDKQRRAFFATDGFGRGIPTRRSGAYRKGYQVFIVPSPDGVLVVLRNTVPSAAFVGGIWQQRFHANTGWEKVSNVLPQLAQVAELEISLVLDEFWSMR